MRRTACRELETPRRPLLAQPLLPEAQQRETRRPQVSLQGPLLALLQVPQLRLPEPLLASLSPVPVPAPVHWLARLLAPPPELSLEPQLTPEQRRAQRSGPEPARSPEQYPRGCP